jgi:D-galactarolactone cycloisomerase
MEFTMKILSINTYHVRAPLENPFGFSQFYYAQRENLLVEVVAEDGTSGWGECYGPAGPVKAAIHTCLLPLVIGQDCLHHELIWHKIWERFMDYARYGSMIAALSGIDIALWDLKGKLLGQPLHSLLGGTEYDSMPLYATGHYFRQAGEGEMIQIISDEAAQHVESGFKALKMKIGKNEAFDRRVIETVRQRFPDLTLMADANHAYNPNEALRMGRVLEANGYSFFEEPVAPHAYEDFAFLRAKLDVAIATGECEQTRFGFRRLIESGGVDILQPDLAHCGGISEGLKIRALANAFGVDVTPHAWGTWIGFAAALHFHAVCPHNPGRYEIQPLYLECDNSENPFKDRAFTEKILIKDGRAHLPQGLGLGVQVDKDALDEFIVTR